ncbi:MAG TPA: hypothetical protein VJB57_14630 [Dehalococcoidia bacterium]|nr:hypothetical protein [Dehalococcoidia bacterium]
MNTEWLILADSAQVMGGKLYLLGGGWDVLTVNQPFPVTRHVAVAASYLFTWNETNQRHDVEIVIVSEDGNEMAKIAAQVEVGRPAGTPPGSDQRAQIAAELDLQFNQAGAFAILSTIEGREDLRTSFRVVTGAPQFPGPQ